jgi:hypothetical protein
MRLEVGNFTVGWTALKIVLNKMVKHEISCSVNQHISSNRGCKPFQKSSKNNAWSNTSIQFYFFYNQFVISILDPLN